MRTSSLITIAGVVILVLLAIPLVRFLAQAVGVSGIASGVNVSLTYVNSSGLACPEGYYMLNATINMTQLYDERLYITLFEGNGTALVYSAPFRPLSAKSYQAILCLPSTAVEGAVKESTGVSGYIYGIYFISINLTATGEGSGG